MPERDDLERDLARAWRALPAPEAMKARVRARLAASQGPPEGPATPAPGASRKANAKGLLASGRKLVAYRPHLATVTLLMVSSFAAGFWLRREPSPATAVGSTRDASSTVEVSSAADHGARSVRNAGSDAELRPLATPNVALSPSHVASPQATRQRSVRHARAAAGLKESAWQARTLRRGDDNLAGEVALLQRAEHAIRAGDAELALALLTELDREFPAASLPEERAAARVLAQCTRARTSAGPSEASRARAGAESFLADDPASVYATRIRSSCSFGVALSETSGRSEERDEPGH
ncbi:MAG: hypothetical protein ABI895_33265 [Deltaproteobacteria bacterium]